MNTFRLMLLGTVAAGLTAAAVAPASAGEVEKSVKLAGQVSRTVGIIDDGVESDVYGGDNNQASSRLKITGLAKGEDLTAKAYVEFNVVGENNQGQDTNGNTFAMRQSYVSLKNDMGELSIGHTTTASHGATTSSFSGVSAGSNMGDPVFSGVTFRTSAETAGQEASTNTLSTSLENGDLDGYFTTGRENTVKYTSPAFNGFTAMVSADANGSDGVGSDVGGQIKYSADYDGTKVKAAVSYANVAGSNTTHENILAGSVAVELGNGLNASIAGGTRDAKASTGRKDHDGWSATIGYDAALVDAGETSFNVMYETHDDKGADGTEYETVAVNVEQDLTDYGTVLTAGVQNFEYKTTTVNYQDITAGWVGVRVNF